jgi:hypothetical protein
MPNLKAGFAAIAILGLPILIAAAIFGPSAFDLIVHRRPPERYLIPAGYTGWVRVDYRQPGAPALPSEDGRRMFQVNAQGTLQTSSDPRPGRGVDEFFYCAKDRRTPLSNAGVCKGGMIWGLEMMVDDHSARPFARFFVGTEDQYRHEVDPTGKNLPACE